jgi:hypothetical protein
MLKNIVLGVLMIVIGLATSRLFSTIFPPAPETGLTIVHGITAICVAGVLGLIVYVAVES